MHPLIEQAYMIACPADALVQILIQPTAKKPPKQTKEKNVSN